MTNLDCILKCREIILLTNICIVKAMIFPVFIFGCERCTIMRLSTEELMLSNCDSRKRLLKFPWTAWRSSQSMLKEINREYSLEGLILKLRLQYFGYLVWRADSLEKTLMLGKIKVTREGDNRWWDGWMASLSQWTWIWANLGK